MNLEPASCLGGEVEQVGQWVLKDSELRTSRGWRKRMLELGCGEFEVLGINQAGSLVAQRRAQGTFTITHSSRVLGSSESRGGMVRVS